MNYPEEITKTTPNYIIKWVLKERQQYPSPALKKLALYNEPRLLLEILPLIARKKELLYEV